MLVGEFARCGHVRMLASPGQSERAPKLLCPCYGSGSGPRAAGSRYVRNRSDRTTARRLVGDRSLSWACRRAPFCRVLPHSAALWIHRISLTAITMGVYEGSRPRSHNTEVSICNVLKHKHLEMTSVLPNTEVTCTPEELPMLRTMLGKTAAGVWTLRVADAWFWDKASLDGWRFGAKVSQPLPASPRSQLVELKATPKKQKSKAPRRRRAQDTV